MKLSINQIPRETEDVKIIIFTFSHSYGERKLSHMWNVTKIGNLCSQLLTIERMREWHFIIIIWNTVTATDTQSGQIE